MTTHTKEEAGNGHDKALQAFAAYFIKNYPSDTIIGNPAWHAPRIFRAAKHALGAGSCVCGDPSSVGVEHRKDGPCYVKEPLASQQPAGAAGASETEQMRAVLREIFERRPCDYGLDLNRVRAADCAALARIQHLIYATPAHTDTGIAGASDRVAQGLRVALAEAVAKVDRLAAENLSSMQEIRELRAQLARQAQAAPVAVHFMRFLNHGASWLEITESHMKELRAAGSKAELRTLYAAPAVVSAEQVLSNAASDVLAERKRQVSVEGWTPEHDDQHGEFSMSYAAACYALAETPAARVQSVDIQRLWEWTGWSWFAWWKPKDRRRNLVRSGALILAEIERLDRAALRTPASTSGTSEQGGA